MLRRDSVTLSALGDSDRMSFPRLQKLLAMTGGNLSTHLRRLEDAGYVAVTKTDHNRRFGQRRPHSEKEKAMTGDPTDLKAEPPIARLLDVSRTFGNVLARPCLGRSSTRRTGRTARPQRRRQVHAHLVALRPAQTQRRAGRDPQR